MSAVTYSIPPGGVKPHHLSGKQSGGAEIYGCRGWVNFYGTGSPGILSSGNVSSITDYGVGDYGVNFITGLDDEKYCAVYGSMSQAGVANAAICEYGTVAKTITHLRIAAFNAVGGGNLDLPSIQVAVFR